jgi:hypothetical protein
LAMLFALGADQQVLLKAGVEAERQTISVRWCEPVAVAQAPSSPWLPSCLPPVHPDLLAARALEL